MKIRKREENFKDQFTTNKLMRDESTYHFSSEEKEKAFIDSQFRTPGDISQYNEYRKEWHRRADKFDPGSFPLAVICELVSFCNLKCEMCYTISPEYQDAVVGAQRIMPWDIAVKIIDECAEIGVYSMLFSWRGEPTLYRSKGSDGKYYDFADVLAYARSKGILEVTSLTNGRALNDSLIEKIVQAQPNWISFSIDGMEKEYGKIRKSRKSESGKDPFTIVVENINKIVKLRDRLKHTMPQIRTNTIYPPISGDIDKYRTFMEEAGVGLVTVNEILDFRGDELPEEAIVNNWYCQYPFQRLVVSANGIVLPCPGSHNEEEELILGRYIGTPEKKITIKGKTKIISCPEVTLKQAWESEKIKKVRSLHRENQRTSILTCKHCRHGAKKHGVTWIPPDWDMKKMEWIGREWRNG